jgi:hypothetical protein
MVNNPNKKADQLTLTIDMAITLGIFIRSNNFSNGCKSTAIRKEKPKGNNMSCPIYIP